jgi:hypothetical protein
VVSEAPVISAGHQCRSAGVPSARWLSARKDWVDQDGNFIRGGGPEGVGRCPCRIAIISTGLIFQQAPEGEVLLRRRAARGESAFGTLILDEAHRQGLLGLLGGLLTPHGDG